TLQNEIASLPASLREALRKGTGSITTGGCQGAQCPPTDPATLAAIAAYGASLAYISPDNTTVQLSVVFKNDPYSLDAINEIAPLRTAVNLALSANQLSTQEVTVHLAGQTSLLADTLGYNQRDTF